MNESDPARPDLTRADARIPTPSVPTVRTDDVNATIAYPSVGPGTHTKLPRELPGYDLVRELGRGAFGVVYFGRAKDRPSLSLAIKVIEAGSDLDRLMIEPALLSRIHHPGVVRLENYFVHDGRLVLVMEFVPGADLKTVLDRDQHFSPDQVHEFLVQIGSALVEAHAQQIVHRDLKPSNVLVDHSNSRCRYVLVDFGVGRTNEGVQSQKNLGGTFLYMAPEQLRGRPGPQSDLWAVGVIAYQMLTGKLPFPGPSLQDVSRQIQYTDPPPPSAVTGQALPGRMEEAILGLLRKSLSERTATPTELLAQLGVRDESRRPTDSPSTPQRAIPIAEKWRRAARRSVITLGLTLFVYIAVNGFFLGISALAGLYLFYHAQAHVSRRRNRVLLTSCSFLVLSPRIITAFMPEDEPPSLAYTVSISDFLDLPVPVVVACLVVLVLALTLLLPVVGSAAYANLRHARREQALLSAALAGQSGSEEYLNLMRDMVATRFEDVGFHLRYAELLYARRDFRGAAVEARLITVQDPYHFNANLLLANSYFALGLERDCRHICDEYLAVTGYCFEFQELRDQCVGGAVA